MEPMINELRELYLKNNILVNVDSFKIPNTDTVRIESQWITADPMDDAYLKINTTASFDLKDDKLTNDHTLSQEAENIMIQKYSPSGKLKVIFKVSLEGATLEIYKDGFIHHRTAIPPKTHFGLIKNAVFNSEYIQFSQDEKRFLYMADDPFAILPVYKLRELGVNRFIHRDSMGDRMGTNNAPTIFIYDIDAKESFRVHKPPETAKSRIVYIQPRFADPEGKSIVCVSMNMVEVTDQSYFTNYPKKLELFTGLDVDKAIVGALGAKLWLIKQPPIERHGVTEEVACYPKLSDDFSKVSYLFQEKCPIAALNSCGLRVLDLKTMKTETIVENMEEDAAGFAGINGIHATLAKYNWVNDHVIMFTSNYHQSHHIFEVDVLTKTVKRVSTKVRYLATEAHSFLGVLAPNVFVGKRDCLYKNGILFVGRRNKDGSITEYDLPENGVDEKSVSFFDEEIKIDGVEATFYGIRDASVKPETRPLILYIHGGPHSVWPNVYNPFLAYCMKNQMTVLNVNYSGTNGRGNKFAKQVLGRAGEFEPEEIMKFVKYLEQHKRCDATNIKVLTGSYGGYVALFMMSRYPDLIKSASIFNPVVNVLSMWVGSTVTGWVHSEIFGDNENKHKFEEPLSDEKFLLAKRKSPLFADYKFKGEVLIFTGLKDDVVPPNSTRYLYRKLRALGLKAELFEYPQEEHLITMIGPNFDYCVKSALLFFGKFKFTPSE